MRRWACLFLSAMTNRFAFVIVAIAVPVAGFFIHKNAREQGLSFEVTGLETPEKRDFAPIEKELPEPEPEPEEPARIRHDQEKVDQFSGQPISEMIAALSPEKAIPDAIEPTMFDALPEAAFPFSGGTEPRDKAALANFISTNQQDTIDEPTLLDRWRVNVAHAGLGTYPDAVADNYLFPGLLDAPSEQFPVHFKNILNLNSGSVFAVADFDSDGRDDLIGKGGTTLWKFFDSDPIGTDLPAANGLFPADFDGDGDVDLFATRTAGLPNSLWINEGGGTFIDFTEGAGLLSFADTRAAAWGDFNRDGKLDLAVGNFDAPLEIYLAVGDGTFEYASDKLGVEDVKKVLELTRADIDGDGTSDLFANIADGPDRALLTATAITGLEWETPDSTSVFADFDNDNDLDVVIASRSENSESAFVTTLVDDDIEARLVRFFQNDGEGKFTDLTAELELPDLAGATSLAAADLDADGFEELIVGGGSGVPNRIFWNRDGIAFREATVTSELGFLADSQSIQTSDTGLVFDGTVANGTPPSHQLTIHLEKNSTASKICVVTRDHDWILHSTFRVANGYQPTIIGLGDAKTIETIEVIWPEECTPPSKYLGKDVPLNSRIAIERGGDAVIVLDE